MESPIGERLRRVRNYLDDDDYFLANYADVLTDAPLDEMIERTVRHRCRASMLVVPPASSFHCVNVNAYRRGRRGDARWPTSPSGVNGGYFVLHQDRHRPDPRDGDLVADACESLAGTGKLIGYRHDGFWKPADTFKERAELDAAYQQREPPVGTLGVRQGPA